MTQTYTSPSLSGAEALLLFEAFNGDLNRMAEAAGAPVETIRRALIAQWASGEARNHGSASSASYHT